MTEVQTVPENVVAGLLESRSSLLFFCQNV